MDRAEVFKVGRAMADRIKAKDDRVETRLHQTRYVLERLIGRLCEAAPGMFVMKGGTLFLVHDDPSRPTEDVDLQWNDEAVEVKVGPALEMAMGLLAADGALFEAALKFVPIRHGLMPGVRVTTEANLGGARVVKKLDIGCGDAVTPAPVMRELKPLLPKHCLPVVVPCYPWETVVAEKVHAMREHGVHNTRYKDYYDLVAISRREEIDGGILVEAIRATFEARNRHDRDVPLDGRLPALDDAGYAKRAAKDWEGWKGRMAWLSEEAGTLAECLAEIDGFVREPFQAASEGHDFERLWRGGEWTDPAPKP